LLCVQSVYDFQNFSRSFDDSSRALSKRAQATHGKSTLRFFAPSIISTDARGACGAGALGGAAFFVSTRGRTRRTGFVSAGRSLFNEPGSGCGIALLSPVSKPR